MLLYDSMLCYVMLCCNILYGYYFILMLASLRRALLLCEPSPRETAAEAAIQPPIWCFAETKSPTGLLLRRIVFSQTLVA